MARAVRYQNTETASITLAGDTYNSTKLAAVRIVADVAFHVAYDRAATTNDPLIPANTVEYLHVDEDTVLHFLRADGEVDGKAWITQVGLG